METQSVITTSSFHDELTSRRRRLQNVLEHAPTDEHLQYLLHEVDAALERIDNGSYGLCETCRDVIEPERLAVDPLLRNCLDHLSPSEQRALERDLDLAFQIQQQLLPKNSIDSNGWCATYHYEPAGAVSGDYLDMFTPDHAASSLFFNIGDVMGKGVAASILMGHLHAMFRSLAILDLPLNQVVSQANRIFCEGTTRSHFATLVSGRAYSNGVVELCNAGHPYPVIVRANGTIETLPSASMPIGVFCESVYTLTRAELASGDLLVFYTDGFTEASNASHEQYGDERLLNLLSAQTSAEPRALLEACIRDLRSFKEGIAKTDDLTILVLQRQR